jgi:hypothetical protein
VSQPSPLEIVGGPRNGGEGTGWTLLRYGWPALILALSIAAGTLLEPPGPDGFVDLSVYGLSAEALTQGRWWTLVSHVFLPVPVFPAILLGAALLIAGLTPTATANPGWLGGWRTPAVFMASAGFGALAVLSIDPARTLSGPWSGALGLLVYHLAARRSRSAEPEAAPAPDSDETRRSEAVGSALNWFNTWLQVLLLAPLFDLYPSPLPGDGSARFFIAAVVIVGGAVLVYAGTIFGGTVTSRILGAVRWGLMWIWVLALTAVAAGWLAENWLRVLELPWPGYAAGVFLGLTLGLIERRRLRVH